MTGPYCGDCEGSPESQENVNGESAPSGIEKRAATTRNGFAGTGGEAETEKNSSEPAGRRKLHLTSRG